MSSLAFPSENHVGPSSADLSHDSTISRPRYVVLQSLVGVMLAYQLLSGAELIASRSTSGVIVGGLVAMVLCLWYVPDLNLTGRVVQRTPDRNRYGSRDRDHLSFG